MKKRLIKLNKNSSNKNKNSNNKNNKKKTKERGGLLNLQLLKNLLLCQTLLTQKPRKQQYKPRKLNRRLLGLFLQHLKKLKCRQFKINNRLLRNSQKNKNRKLYLIKGLYNSRPRNRSQKIKKYRKPKLNLSKKKLCKELRSSQSNKDYQQPRIKNRKLVGPPKLLLKLRLQAKKNKCKCRSLKLVNRQIKIL